MRTVWINMIQVYVIIYLALFFVPFMLQPVLDGHRRVSTFLRDLIIRVTIMLLSISAVTSMKYSYHHFLDVLCSWKVAFVGWLVITVFSLTQIGLYGPRMLDHWLNIRWNWIGVITYATLFMLLNFLYQRQRIPAFKSAMISLYSCQLSAILYELPLIFTKGVGWLTNGILLNPLLYTSIFVLLVMLTEFKFKWSWTHLLPFTPLLMQWIWYYNLPGWSVRLGPWLLLMSMSVTIKPFRRRRK